MNTIHEFTPEEKFNLDVIMFDVEMEDQAEKINQLHKKGSPAKIAFDKAFSELRNTAGLIKSFQLQAAFQNYNEQKFEWIKTIFKWTWAVNVRGKLATKRYNNAYKQLNENIQKLHEILDDNINLVQWAYGKNLLNEDDFQRIVAELSNEIKKTNGYLKMTGNEVTA